jgi:hypothetical protein
MLTKNKTRKSITNALAIQAAIPTTRPKPKKAATIARTRNVRAQPSMGIPLV